MTEPLMPADPFLSDTAIGDSLREGSVIVTALLETVLERDRLGLERAVAVLDRADLERTATAWAVQVGLTHLARPPEPDDPPDGGLAGAEREDDGHRILTDLARFAADGDVDGLLVAVEGSSDANLRAALIDPIGAAVERYIEEHRRREPS